MPPFRHTVPVRFADVDHAGIVYYPRFFHYFHLAFEELFRQRMGARAYVDLLDRKRVGFPAVRAECDYKAPLRFGDIMDIELSIARLGNRSLTFRYQVYRRDDGDRPQDGSQAGPSSGPGSRPPASRPDDPPARVLAAEGITVCAVVDLDSFRAITVPDDIRALLAPLAE